MEKKRKKLVLNQQTLTNLTAKTSPTITTGLCTWISTRILCP